MAFTVAGSAIDPHNGQPTDGLTCDAFNEETWFPSSSPIANTAEPGTPDATDTSGPTGASGMAGHFLITVPTSGSYWIATYNSWDPTVIAWVKALTHPHTQLQGWTATGLQTAYAVQTTIAAGSNGVALPTGTINVASSSGWPSSGWLIINISAGVWTAVQYTGGTGGTSFTGCTGGTGTLATGQVVTFGLLNGAYRRLAMLTVNCNPGSNGTVNVKPLSTINGAITQLNQIFLGTTTSTIQGALSMTFPVDPNGIYGVNGVVAGTGVIGGSVIIYADF